MKGKITYKCEFCGKEVIRANTKAERLLKKHFCNRDCYLLYIRVEPGENKKYCNECGGNRIVKREDKTILKNGDITIGYWYQCLDCFNARSKALRVKRRTEKRKCKFCEKEFIYNTKQKNFCSEKCRIKYWCNDPSRKLTKKIMSVAYRATAQGVSTNRVIKYMGCSIDELKDHLQNTAIQNGYLLFDINNFSGKDYHIDHIRPCSSYDLLNVLEQRECFHYTNLQILSAKENLLKSCKYEQAI